MSLFCAFLPAFRRSNQIHWAFKRSDSRTIHDLCVTCKFLQFQFHYGMMMEDMPLSSSGSGHFTFKEAGGIRLPMGVLWKEVADRLSINKKARSPCVLEPLIILGTNKDIIGIFFYCPSTTPFGLKSDNSLNFSCLILWNQGWKDWKSQLQILMKDSLIEPPFYCGRKLKDTMHKCIMPMDLGHP